MERYYQIARCYRDEDFRADRQPEFTQLDIEMSFVEQDDVIELGEEIVARALEGAARRRRSAPFPRMTYAEAMRRYGSDKPDLRFGLELVDLTDVLRRHRVPGLPGRRTSAPSSCPAAPSQPRKQLDALAGLGQAARRQGPGLRAWSTEDGELGGPVAKNLSEAERRRPARRGRREARRLRVLRRGHRARDALELLGAAAPRDRHALRPDRRVARGRSSGSSTRRCSSATDDDGGWTAVHHPFTSPERATGSTASSRARRARRWPTPTTSSATATRSAAARSVSTRRDVQQRVFDLLGISREEAAGQVRLPARGVQVRPAAARRHRVRLGPHLHAARRRAVDPRGDRVPEDAGRVDPLTGRRRRSPRSSAGGRHRREAQDPGRGTGSGCGTGRIGSGRIGSGRIGSGRIGSSSIVTAGPLLVIGASGYLGRHVCRRAVAGGVSVVGTFHSRPLDIPGVAWHRLDVSSPPSVLALVRSIAPSAIVNACLAGDSSLAGPPASIGWTGNALGAVHVARAAADAGARLVHVSSDAVHAGHVDRSPRATIPARPTRTGRPRQRPSSVSPRSFRRRRSPGYR